MNAMKEKAVCPFCANTEGLVQLELEALAEHLVKKHHTAWHHLEFAVSQYHLNNPSSTVR